MKKNKHRGSDFDNFLDENGLLEEVEAISIKKTIAMQLEEAMRDRDINKTAMAKLMRTSRAALDRLLDPTNTSVTLTTVVKAMAVVDKKININISDLNNSTRI